METEKQSKDLILKQEVEDKAKTKALTKKKTVKKRKGLTIKEKRKLAQLGMTASLVTVIATGVNWNRENKKLHTYASFALVGFSAYHVGLYARDSRKKK